MCIGTDLCGEPTRKSLPGDVERLGPSDLLHSDTFLLRHDCGFEHSELLRDLFERYMSQSFFTTGIIKAMLNTF